MMKGKKITAFMIAAIMVMSNFMGLLGNISFANGDEITVEFSVENDGAAHLSDDGKTLNYQCSDGSGYDIELRQNGEPITLTKQGDPVNGDKYIATGITSNEDLQIYSPRINLGMLGIFFGGQQMGMFPTTGDDEDYYSSYLAGWENTDYYQIRIQEVHPGENGGQNGGENTADRDFTVDFGPATWTIDDETTVATIEGLDLTNGPVQIKGNTEIVLSNWNPDLMEPRITIIDDQNREFGTRLFVDENGVTRMMDFDAGHLPDGDVTFTVQRKVEHHDEGQQENMAETIYSVDFGTATWEVRNETTVATIEGLDLTNGRVEIRGDEVIHLSNWDSRLMQASIMVVDPEIEEEGWFRDRLEVSENGETRIMDIRANNMPHPENSYIVFYVERYQGEAPENELPPANTSANITVTGGADCNVPYINARIAINGYGIWLDDPEQNPDIENEVTTIENFEYCYNEEDNGKVTISLGAIFVNKYVGTFSINGVEFTVADFIDYSDRTDWLDHYSGQMVGFEVIVDKADNYDIVVNLDEMEGHYIAIGNFLWTDDPAESESDLYIGNSTLEVVSVTYEYDGQEIYVEEQDLYDDPHIEYNPYGVYGSLVVPEGAMCTMRITPDYGYQVTSFGVNGGEIVTGDAISVFEFPIHKGNFHLMAEVTPVDDVVDAQSDKVRSGNIEISANEIDSGTVVLSVDDLNPTEEKREEFEEAAGDYEVDTYLDISLDQVLYKGTADNVWAMGIHELNDEATIELELEEDVNNKNIIIIHNTGDGDNYDIIEIESYDPATNTITFKTDSFSAYAIALKDNPNTTNPDDPNPDDPNPDDPNPDDPNPDDPNPDDPTVEMANYSLSAGDYVAEFTAEEGHEFELQVMELYNLTPEVLSAIGYTEEEYEAAKEEIEEELKDYGTILEIYSIVIADEEYEHTEETIFKIKMTEEMEKYNSFKFISLDEEDAIIEVTIEDGELVANLPYTGTYALVAEEPEPVAQEKYTVTEGNFTVIFSDEAGHEFELEVMELLNLTPAQLEEFGIPEEEYEAAVKEITEALKEYGTILNVYQIEVYDGQYDHTSELTIRIKMTDEMKEYNSFKFICIDNEELSNKDIVELKEKDGYLEGNLFHLSNYALVAKKVETETTEEATQPTSQEPQTATEETTTTEATNNPKTGDNIMFFVAMFVISIVGLGVIKFKK